MVDSVTAPLRGRMATVSSAPPDMDSVCVGSAAERVSLAVAECVGGVSPHSLCVSLTFLKGAVCDNGVAALGLSPSKTVFCTYSTVHALT